MRCAERAPLPMCFAAAICCLAARPLVALELELAFDDSVPYFDRFGVDRTYDLPPIVSAAAAIWADLIEDDVTLQIPYGWRDLPSGQLGACTMRLAFDTHFNRVTPRMWFFDPTPHEHSEFDFSVGQKLWLDLAPDAQRAAFVGDPPPQLEVGYLGRPRTADQGNDLLTVALHEIGHWLGVNRFDAYQVPARFVGGRTLAIAASVGHLPFSTALMSATLGASRRLPSAVDALAAAASRGWTRIDLPRKEFYGSAADPLWNAPENWSGGQAPDASDTVFLRHGGAVQLATSQLEPVRVAGLTVADGATLVLEDGERLHVLSDPVEQDPRGAVVVDLGGAVALTGLEGEPPALAAVTVRVGGARAETGTGGRLELAHGRVAASEGLFVEDTGCVAGGGWLEADVFNRGSVSARAALGGLWVAGNYVQTSEGRLHLACESTSPRPLLDVAGTAVLDGALRVAFLSPPGAQAEYALLAAAEIRGGFSSVELPAGWRLSWQRSPDALWMVESLPEPSSWHWLGGLLAYQGRWMRRRKGVAPRAVRARRTTPSLG